MMNGPAPVKATVATTPVIVGVAGGTGSGKTTVVSEILRELRAEDVAIIQHDSYYKDRSYMSSEERSNVNYDHPDALDTSLLVQHLLQLRAGYSVEVPVYDFATHTRTIKTEIVTPCKVIVVEGILILADPSLRCLFEIKIFVDTDADIRFIRRMERDIAERSRTRASVVRQYLESVRPMHLEFVEPSKRYADVIIPDGGFNHVAVDMLMTKLKSIIERNF
jgi:uridine kinase